MVSQTNKQGRQNSSRVRDHLANERTYLAWMRSAIALMGFGVVIVRLRYIVERNLVGFAIATNNNKKPSVGN